MGLVYLLNDSLSWHDRDRWDNAVSLLREFLVSQKDRLRLVAECAAEVRDATGAVDSFIQHSTAEVCPQCARVCCANRHAYYNHEDLIYALSIGLEVPQYREGLDDGDPCQFISEQGCTLERSARPFRCNWYFCPPLVKYMEEGPGRPYRAFIDRFGDLLAWRNRMIEEFWAVLREEEGRSHLER